MRYEFADTRVLLYQRLTEQYTHTHLRRPTHEVRTQGYIHRGGGGLTWAQRASSPPPAHPSPPHIEDWHRSHSNRRELGLLCGAAARHLVRVRVRVRVRARVRVRVMVRVYRAHRALTPS